MVARTMQYATVSDPTFATAENTQPEPKKSSLFGEIAASSLKKTLRDTGYQQDPFNPTLVWAILTRQPKNIRLSLDPSQRFLDDSVLPTLPNEQYKDLSRNKFFSGVLARPALLAIKLCYAESPEATQYTDHHSRYDILHCIAENWGLLIKDAKRKGHRIPNLSSTLYYAKKLSEEFENETPLLVFINGLADEYRSEAEEIMETLEKETSSPSMVL